MLRTVAAQLDADGQVPSRLRTGSTRGEWRSAESTPLLLLAAAQRARVRPAVLLDGVARAPDVMLEEALAQAARYLVEEARTGEWSRTPVSRLGTHAASRFPGADPATEVVSGDRAATAHAGLLAAAELAMLTSACGPVWGGPTEGECLAAAEQLAEQYVETGPFDGSPAALAHAVAAGVMNYPQLTAARAEAVVTVAAAVTAHGIPSVVGGGRCWVLDSWAAHQVLGLDTDAGPAALAAVEAACSQGFPAWVELRDAQGGDLATGPQYAPVVALVLAVKCARGAGHPAGLR